jgi:hypothetical protein
MADRRFRILPWPPRAQRKERIAEARVARSAAEEQRDQAKKLDHEVSTLARANHFSEALARQLEQGRS